jgi:signal peptidase I
MLDIRFLNEIQAPWNHTFAPQGSHWHSYNRPVLQRTGETDLTKALPASDTDELDQPTPSARRSIWGNLAEVVAMLLIVYGAANFLLVECTLIGASMAPLLQQDQHILANRLIYIVSTPQRGDVVVVRDPLNPARLLVRRVIGLPGDRLELRGQQVLVNDQPLVENYIGSPLSISSNLTATAQLQLQADEYYLLGDNRLSINDSRSWGALKSGDIVARAWLAYWPPDSIAFTPHERYQTNEQQ